VTAGCDHCSAWHHFWRACHLLYNDHRQIQALPDGELRSDLEKYIDDQVKTRRYREAKDDYQAAKEDFSQDNCLTLVGNKEKFENADWIIEHFRRLRSDKGMGGVGRGEGGGGLLESGGGPMTMGSGTASKANSMALDSAAFGGEYLQIVTNASVDSEKTSTLTALLRDEDPKSVVIRIFCELGLFVVQDDTSCFSGIPDWCVLEDALRSAASGRQLPPGGIGGGSSGGVGESGGGANGGCGIDKALRLRSSTSNIMVDGGRAVPAVTFQARTLGGGMVEIGGGPTTMGGNASEIQQGGAVAPAGGGASGVNRPSGEKGATPPLPRGEPDGAAGSSSSAGDKRKASVDVEMEDDEVYLNFA